MGKSFTLFNPGRAAEAFFLIPSPPGTDVPDAASEVLSGLKAAWAETGSAAAGALQTRIYLRGGSRALEAFLATPLYREISRGAVSIVGQDPLEGGPVALFSQHILSPEKVARLSPLGSDTGHAPAGTLLQGAYTHIWLNHPASPGEAGNIRGQTARCLEAWNRKLDSQGMNWAEHVLRTWFFIDDIDRNYAGMVQSRQEFFSRQGLSPNHRFPASTGIGARGTGTGPGLAAELMASKGFSEGQIQAMRDERNMPPAMSYGVSFERGIKVRFGDRVHCHVSGTASIGRRGEILHPEDAERQTGQALGNVESLLATAGLGLSHLAYLLAYVRDPASAPRVRAVLSRCLPESVPLLILEGAVCRPGWLVEVEGQALKAEPGPGKDFP